MESVGTRVARIAAPSLVKAGEPLEMVKRRKSFIGFDLWRRLPFRGRRTNVIGIETAIYGEVNQLNARGSSKCGAKRR